MRLLVVGKAPCDQHAARSEIDVEHTCVDEWQ
jgi:hypothetical protein